MHIPSLSSSRVRPRVATSGSVCFAPHLQGDRKLICSSCIIAWNTRCFIRDSYQQRFAQLPSETNSLPLKIGQTAKFKNVLQFQQFYAILFSDVRFPTTPQLSELPVEGLSQLSEEVEESLFFAAPFGAAFIFFLLPLFCALFPWRSCLFSEACQRSHSVVRQPCLFQGLFASSRIPSPWLARVLRKSLWAGIKDETIKQGEGKRDETLKMQR